MKRIYTNEQFENMKANEVRKQYRNGTSLWRSIDTCLALIEINENVREALKDLEVEIVKKSTGEKEMQRIGDLSNGTYYQQIKAIAYILGEEYEVIRKAMWSMYFKQQLEKVHVTGSFNPYIAMGQPGYMYFVNNWEGEAE